METMKRNAKELQNYCKRNYPECYKPLDKEADYTIQKEIDEELNRLFKNAIKLF